METVSNAPSVSVLADPYLTADDLERRVIEATLRCISRWGLAKTSFEDIAREARASRATVYRVVPGGKERLVEVVMRYELGRVAHEVSPQAEAAESLEDLLCLGLTTGIRLLTEHEALQYLVTNEPGTVLPHFAFHRLEELFAQVTKLSEPYLQRFLPAAAIPPAVELLVRVALTYSMLPSKAVDPHEPESIRELVRVYLLPAVTTAGGSGATETSKSSERTETTQIIATSEVAHERREL